jgi:DNA-binding GntR family transcriptional regulator
MGQIRCAIRGIDDPYRQLIYLLITIGRMSQETTSRPSFLPAETPSTKGESVPPSAVVTAITPAPLSESAYALLRDRIVFLEIAPGEPVNEASIATELGFGRTPVREALKRLEADHLVVSYPRRGTFATNVDLAELNDLGEIRRLLEPLAARRAALHRGTPLREEIQEVLASLSDDQLDSDRPALLRQDTQVHQLIYQAAGNEHLVETLMRMDALATRIWGTVLDRLPNFTENIAEHRALLQAVLDGDPDRAATLAEEHVDHFTASVQEALTR